MNIDLVRVTLLRESIFKRMCELAKGAQDECLKDRKVSAILLARGLMETEAFFSYFLNKIKLRVENNKSNELNEFLTIALLGARSPMAVEEFKRPKAINVLTCIDFVDKSIPQYRAQYDFLSEFSHPNSAGLNLMYCKIDKENAEAIFNDTTEMLDVDFIINQVGASVERFTFSNMMILLRY